MLKAEQRASLVWNAFVRRSRRAAEFLPRHFPNPALSSLFDARATASLLL